VTYSISEVKMQRNLTGLACIALAVGFNVPFALLAAQFDYPDILRRPAGEVLAAFAAGGSGLVWIWYAFALTALAMVPLSVAVAFGRADWQTRPALAVSGAVFGALAGLAQAIGLFRWVFAVPPMAAAFVDPAATAAQQQALEVGFLLMNNWGGVAIGEHMGQILTCLWIGTVSAGLWRTGRMVDRIAAGIAVLAIAGIVIGLGDGLSVALGAPIAAFSLFTVGGYLAMSVWLIVLGLGFMVRSEQRVAGRAV
jgi:Domain of unknown function (DUF4386)